MLIKGTRFRLPWLLAASYVFYGWWNPVYLLLILWATTVDYLAVRAMASTRWKKPWLALSIVNNLGLLGFFKYGRFVVDNVNALAERFDLPYALERSERLFSERRLELAAVVAAAALSGSGFQLSSAGGHLVLRLPVDELHDRLSIADRSSGNAASSATPRSSPCFRNWWPGRSSGPVTCCRNCTMCHAITRHDVADGLSLFVVGLFKKIALADYLALYVDPVYAAPGNIRRRRCCWPRLPSPGRSTSTSAATPTWLAASAG